MKINGVKCQMFHRAIILSAFISKNSSGKLKFSSSQPTLSYRVGHLTPFNYMFSHLRNLNKITM